MCEYLRIRNNKMPLCVVNNADCTYCVLGNAKTYKQAKEKEITNESVQNKTKLRNL